MVKIRVWTGDLIARRKILIVLLESCARLIVTDALLIKYSLVVAAFKVMRLTYWFDRTDFGEFTS